MNTLLIYPPWRQPFMPPLNIAALTGFFEAEGVDCRQRDLNLETITRLIEPAWLERTGREAQRRIEEIEQSERIDGETALFHESLVGASLRLPALAALVGEAQRTMRDPARFYRLEEYRSAIRVIEEALRAVSLAWSPCWFRMHGHRSAGGDRVPNGPAEEPAGGEERLLATIFQEAFIPSIAGDPPGLLVVLADYQSQLLPALTLLRQVRRQLPGVRTAMAGWMSEELLGRPVAETGWGDAIDVMISGRLEEPVLRLARAMETGPLDEVPGLQEGDPDGPPVLSARRVLSPEELPGPSYGGLQLDRYLSPHPVLPVRASSRSAEQIITLSSRHHVRHFLLTGALDSPTAEAVAARLGREASPTSWFATLGRSALPDDAHCRRLAEGGCVKLQLLVGPEALGQSDDILEQARRSVKCAPPAGIGVHLHCRLDEEAGGTAVAQPLSGFFAGNRALVSVPGFSFSCRVVRSGRRGPAYGGSSPDLYNDATAPVPGAAPGFGRDPGDGDLPSEEPWEEQRWRLVREAGAAMGPCLTPGTAVHDFLYLAHYHGDPPAPPSAQAPRGTVLKPGLVLRPPPGLTRLRLQAFDPAVPVEGKEPSSPLSFVAAGPRWRAATGDGYHCRPLSDLAMAIIDQCDGVRAWEEAVEAAGPVDPPDHGLGERLVRMMLDEGLLEA